MVHFGYLYLNNKLTIYDVTQEVRHGRIVYVASLSEDPTVNYASVRMETAVLQLTDFLKYRAQRALQTADVRRFPQRFLKTAI